MGLISFLGKEYLGGNSLEAGVKNAELLFRKGIILHGRPICSTLSGLGEETKSEKNVEMNLQAYRQAIVELGNLSEAHKNSILEYNIRTPFSVSVKLSSITLSRRKDGEVEIEQPALLESNVRNLVLTGVKHKIPITVDMEDHYWTYTTLKLARSIWNKKLPVDIVLQSCLDQTLDDVNLFLDQNLPINKSQTTVRACRGIYLEPAEIATRSASVAKERLYGLVEKLFEAGYFVGIATHDILLSQRIRENIIQKKGIPKERYEYQGLKGIYSFEDVIIPEVLKRGEDVRLYLPVELNPGDGDAYMHRRVVMNHEIVFNYLKDRTSRVVRKLSV